MRRDLGVHLLRRLSVERLQAREPSRRAAASASSQAMSIGMLTRAIPLFATRASTTTESPMGENALARYSGTTMRATPPENIDA
jgi:hypothetical protein